MCLTEKIHVLDELCSGKSYSAVGPKFNINESTICIKWAEKNQTNRHESLRNLIAFSHSRLRPVCWCQPQGWLGSLGKSMKYRARLWGCELVKQRGGQERVKGVKEESAQVGQVGVLTLFLQTRDTCPELWEKAYDLYFRKHVPAGEIKGSSP